MKLLEKHFEVALETPDGIDRLRKLIIRFGITGILVPQNNSEESPIPNSKRYYNSDESNSMHLPLLSKEESPYKLPNNWRWFKYKDVAQLKHGHQFREYDFVSEGIPVIKITQCKPDGTLDLTKCDYIDSFRALEFDNFRIYRGDLLMALTGGTLGKVTRVKKDYGIVVQNYRVGKFIPNELFLTREFLNIILESDLFQSLVISKINQNAQPNVGKDDIENLPIPIPPINEQKRIVEKIDQLKLLCDKLEAERNRKNQLLLQINSAAINNLIEANNQISFTNAWSFIANQFDTLYTLKQNVTDLKNIIYELASRGKIVNQNNDDISVEEQIKIFNNVIYNDDKSIKIKSSKINVNIQINETPFEIPNNWKWMRLKDIAIYNGRPNVKPTEIFDDTWVLDLEDIEKDTSILLNKISNLERQSKSTKSSFKNGDVLYGKLRPYLNKVIIADEDGVCTTEIVPIVPSKLIISEYLKILLKRTTFLNHVNGLSYGVKMPRLGTNDAEMSIHPVPPLAEQLRIVKRVNQLFELCDKLEKNIEQSSKKQSQILNAVLAQV